MGRHGGRSPQNDLEATHCARLIAGPHPLKFRMLGAMVAGIAPESTVLALE
jgi:hypothetical protein